MTILILAFFAGVLTALAPCILPLLPIIIGGSLTSDEKQRIRPYIVAVSLAASIFIFTLLLKASTVLIDISPQTWAIISGGIVIVLGVLTVWPLTWEKFAAKVGFAKRSNSLLGKAIGKKGYAGAIITGAALGPVFTSCSPTYGFILASVLPKNFAEGMIYLLAYCFGLVLVLLLLSLFGQQFLSRYPWAVNPMSWFRRSIGIVFIVIGLMLITGVEKRFQTWLVERNPFDITQIELRLYGNRLEP